MGEPDSRFSVHFLGTPSIPLRTHVSNAFGYTKSVNLGKKLHTGMITRLVVVNNYHFKVVYHAMLSICFTNQRGTAHDAI